MDYNSIMKDRGQNLIPLDFYDCLKSLDRMPNDYRLLEILSRYGDPTTF